MEAATVAATAEAVMVAAAMAAEMEAVAMVAEVPAAGKVEAAMAEVAMAEATAEVATVAAVREAVRAAEMGAVVTVAVKAGCRSSHPHSSARPAARMPRGSRRSCDCCPWPRCAGCPECHGCIPPMSKRACRRVRSPCSWRPSAQSACRAVPRTART